MRIPKKKESTPDKNINAKGAKITVKFGSTKNGSYIQTNENVK